MGPSKQISGGHIGVDLSWRTWSSRKNINGHSTVKQARDLVDDECLRNLRKGADKKGYPKQTAFVSNIDTSLHLKLSFLLLDLVRIVRIQKDLQEARGKKNEEEQPKI